MRILTSEFIEKLKQSERARQYITNADKYLEAIGYTEHGFRHAEIVSSTAYRILRELGYPEEEALLAQIAGYLHDIGNMLGRHHHNRISALLAKDVLEELNLGLAEITRVMMAIIGHEEDEGVIVPDPVGAALLIADKSDVHRSRVRNPSSVSEDIHDRVNFAATNSELIIKKGNGTEVAGIIQLMVTIDTRISQVIDYFEIFLSRMNASRKAAKILNCNFYLYINNTRMA
ncbi:MAG: HD domain-containing protein [Thermodesulfovibrionales bacterium]|nr:HD domain-containing protein [Thermodesulfovibrionales bacterium]